MALDAAKQYRQDREPLIFDLRYCKNIDDIHYIVSHASFEIARTSRYQSLLLKSSLESVFKLLELGEFIFIVDHGEYLNDRKYFKDFLESLPPSCKFIFTSRIPPSVAIKTETFILNMPNDIEALSILKNWIKARENWIKEIIPIIGNHPFVLKRVAISCSGNYINKKSLLNCIRNEIETSGDVTLYFSKLISTLDQNLYIWLSLAFLCDGVIIKEVLPENDQKELRIQGLILSEQKNAFPSTIHFHPIIIDAVAATTSISDASKMIIDHLMTLDVTPFTSFYRFICSIKINRIQIARDILINHWQDWTEVLGSYKSLAILESHAHIINNEIYNNLFIGVIKIYCGSYSYLTDASKLFLLNIQNKNVQQILKTLSILEYIECIRKMDGINSAREVLTENIEEINNGIYKINNDSNIPNEDIFYPYCISTIFFLLGSYFRNNESFSESIQCYQKCISLVGNQNYGNLALQKMHSFYCIADLQLKHGYAETSLETVNHYYLTSNIKSKFGDALMFLLEARAFLVLSEFKSGIENVVIAEKFFKELNLPYYFERCQIVKGCLNLQNGKKNIASNILNELITTSDGALALDVRAKILSNIIIDSLYEIDNNDLYKIYKYNGYNIFRTFCKVLNYSNYEKIIIDYQDRKLITIDENFHLKISSQQKSKKEINEIPIDWLID